MDLGFETIGNATIIAHDKKPILATDPWVEGRAYFGSWSHSHAIPEEQLNSIKQCPYLWISHGHPDHFSIPSLETMKETCTLLLPDHFGGRIRQTLTEKGFKVQVLEDHKWIKLSDRISVFCVSDYNQDAILMIRIGDELVININDLHDSVWIVPARRWAKRFKTSYLTRLTGYGDADMINIFDENGERVTPLAAAAKEGPLGPRIASMTDWVGATHFIPSSSMHQYARKDSLWASEYTTPVDKHGEGYQSDRSSFLPAFLRVDMTKGTKTTIDPPRLVIEPDDPEVHGDNWSDCLEPSDVEAVKNYFLKIRHLHDYLDAIQIIVGGETHTIDMDSKGTGRILAFEAPRGSLMTSVNYEIFDDMLIGNFMKTTLIGNWNPRNQLALNPHITPFIAKYSDNGGVTTPEDIKNYFKEYRHRCLKDFILFKLERLFHETFHSNTPRY